MIGRRDKKNFNPQIETNLVDLQEEKQMNTGKQHTNAKKFYFFWQKDVCSQWHHSDFVVDKITFRTAEQFMMYKKAKLFGDDETAAAILKTSDPRKQKNLGRRVKNFDQQLWDKHRSEIVYQGNYAKFSQDQVLLSFILDPARRHVTFVEASPLDKIWGIGMAEDNPHAQHPDKWNGLNLLGIAISRVRDDLWKLHRPSDPEQQQQQE